MTWSNRGKQDSSKIIKQEGKDGMFGKGGWVSLAQVLWLLKIMFIIFIYDIDKNIFVVHYWSLRIGWYQAVQTGHTESV